MVAKLPRALLVLVPAVGLGACSTIGTLGIENSRTPYNEVIQSTSEQQTLLNLVRVHDGETPLFVDVTEVDAQSSAQAGISGGPSSLGSGTTGALTLAGQYLEQPTVRYQPLLGGPLVAQVSTPVTAESIVNLYNSDWPLGSIFDLTVTRFTPAFDDYHAALDALMTLDRYGALILEAKAPEKPSTRSTSPLAALMTSPAKGDANLVIHFQPAGFRDRFHPCDEGQRALRAGDVRASDQNVTQIARTLWTRVHKLLNLPGDSIVLTLKSGSGAKGRGDGPPRLQTRSALGMLKDAAEGENLIVFDSEERVDEIIANTRDADTSADEKQGGRHSAETSVVNSECHASFYRAGDVDNDWNNRRFTSVDGGATVLSPKQMSDEIRFGNDRRLILVRMTAQRPGDAFAPVFHRGRWYSLRDDDLISKRNLALVAQIDTIQAVAPQSPPLTPAIVVNSR